MWSNSVPPSFPGSGFEDFLMGIRQNLTDSIVPRFYASLSATDDPLTTCSHKKFIDVCSAVEVLYQDYEHMSLSCQSVVLHLQLKNNCQLDSDVSAWFRAALLAQLPHNIDRQLSSFYEYAFRIFSGTILAIEQDIEIRAELGDKGDLECQICEAEALGCRCSAILATFQETNRKLIQMGILDRLCGPTINHLIEEKIVTAISEMCQGLLRSNNCLLENWLEKVALEWLCRIYQQKSPANENCKSVALEETYTTIEQKLRHFLCETYARIIIDQFFNIIIEYPDSGPALDDLRVCLKRVDIRQYLMTTIKRCLETRILHPGVDTSDILTGYVATIKVLRHLDPTGVLLEAIIEPAKAYLRSRPDTVRCVITSLIEETPSDLTEELARSESNKASAATKISGELLNWENWDPDPVDVAVLKKESTKADRSADIISMVIDIYGSKELFVKEYWNLLAKRLLLNLDLNTDREIRNLELLKLRFGEDELHSCEVMLKDISDSKRINAHVQCDTNYLKRKTFDMTTLILSSQFWPAFNKETLELPEKISEQFESYTKSFEAHKGNRSLLWWPTTGMVNLEVEAGGKIMEFTVPPTQATIIIHFERQTKWAVTELAAKMKVTPIVLKKKIAFWQSKGLIRETSLDEYTLVVENEEMRDLSNTTRPVPIEDDEDGDNMMESVGDQREEALQFFWSYIVGMLTNLESLSLERIHQMLKMFASHGPGVEFSQPELRSFLQKKVQAQLLVYVGGAYQLPK